MEIEVAAYLAEDAVTTSDQTTENGENIFLKNVGIHLPNWTVLQSVNAMTQICTHVKYFHFFIKMETFTPFWNI
jgi:hypothetical protein